MRNKLIIVVGEPESVNLEIISKVWKKLNQNLKRKIVFIGNIDLIKSGLKKLKIKLPIEQIDKIENYKISSNFKVLNVPINSNKIVNISNTYKNKYVIDSLNLAHKLAKNKKIKGFINCPIDKKIFKNKNIGVTEYLARKDKNLNNEIMFIHNKKLSVVPLTTHMELKNVSKNITKKKIINKILLLNKYYLHLFKKKPNIGLVGLNPHNDELRINSKEQKIIFPAVRYLNKKKIKIKGPFPADTIFFKNMLSNFDIIIGMYHDQVLGPFKALHGFNAINITLGLSYMRLSPDHGIAKDLIGKNKANPDSLLQAIKFLNKH